MPPECQLCGSLGCRVYEVADAALMPRVEHGLRVELGDSPDDEARGEHYALPSPVRHRCDNG
ncbi:glutaredoxin family protein, partial [Pseudomonas aeruginosa]